MSTSQGIVKPSDVQLILRNKWSTRQTKSTNKILKEKSHNTRYIPI